MLASELIGMFGAPQIDNKTASGRFVRFVAGEKEKYFVGFHFDGHGLLTSCFLARKDYCDEDEAL